MVIKPYVHSIEGEGVSERRLIPERSYKTALLTVNGGE